MRKEFGLQNPNERFYYSPTKPLEILNFVKTQLATAYKPPLCKGRWRA